MTNCCLFFWVALKPICSCRSTLPGRYRADRWKAARGTTFLMASQGTSGVVDGGYQPQIYHGNHLSCHSMSYHVHVLFRWCHQTWELQKTRVSGGGTRVSDQTRRVSAATCQHGDRYSQRKNSTWQ